MWGERRAVAGGDEGRKKEGSTGEWFDLDAGKTVFVFLLSRSYKVLGELKANKINWY